MSIAGAPVCFGNPRQTGVVTGGEGTRTRLDPPGSDEPSSAVVGKTALLGRALRSSTCPLTGSTTTNSRETFRELRKDAYAPESAARQDKKLGDFMYLPTNCPTGFPQGYGQVFPGFAGQTCGKPPGGRGGSRNEKNVHYAHGVTCVLVIGICSMTSDTTWARDACARYVDAHQAGLTFATAAPAVAL
jgi:hypothetical protein